MSAVILVFVLFYIYKIDVFETALLHRLFTLKFSCIFVCQKKMCLLTIPAQFWSQINKFRGLIFFFLFLLVLCCLPSMVFFFFYKLFLPSYVTHQVDLEWDCLLLVRIQTVSVI